MVVFSLLPFLPVLAYGQSVTPADDAYHYAELAGAPHAGNYIEWWYFNFYDAGENVQGIFSYIVIDPANLTGFGHSQMAAVAYGPGGIVTELDQYPVTDFSASSDRANMQVAANSIQAIGGLIVNKASAQGAVPVAFQGYGFKEYTAKTWANP